MTARLDLAGGVVFVHAGSRGCTVTVPDGGPVLILNDRRELDELIAALHDVREALIEEPRHA
jgi:hypothetical protein